MKKILIGFTVLVMTLLCFVSCVSDEHTHSYENGKCSCGEKDPNYHTHTPGEAVREYEIPATCSSAGSYDEVVYCSGCGAEISRTVKTIEKLDHDYTDGSCKECNITDPGFKPDYGGATVWDDRSEIHIIPADGVGPERLEGIKDALSELAGKVYISSIYAMDQPHELVVGYVEDRAVSVKAYRLLERMEKTSYFDARYVIYTEGGKILVANSSEPHTEAGVQETDIDTVLDALCLGSEPADLCWGVWSEDFKAGTGYIIVG